MLTYWETVTLDFDHLHSSLTWNHTYAVVTCCSHHICGQRVLLMDGSVRFVRNSIPMPTWRCWGLGLVGRFQATSDAPLAGMSVDWPGIVQSRES